MNDDQKPRKTKLNWQPAAVIFGQVSTWVAVPIIFALIGGKALDTHFDTKPVIFLTLTGLAFIVSCYGIVKVVSKYMKTLEKEITDDKNKTENL